MTDKKHYLEVDGKKFLTVNRVPNWKLMVLTAESASGDGVKITAALVDFLRTIIKQEDFPRFAEFMDDADLNDGPLAEAIGSWVEEVSGSPKDSTK